MIVLWTFDSHVWIFSLLLGLIYSTEIYTKNYLKWIKICKFKPGLLESSRSHVAAVLWGRPHLSLVDLGGRYLAHRSLYMTMGPLARCTIEHGKPVVKNLRGWEIGFEVTA